MYEFEEAASAASASSRSGQVDELPAAPAEEPCPGTKLDAGSEIHSSDSISQFSDADGLDAGSELHLPEGINNFSDASILDAGSEIQDRISQFSDATILDAGSEIHSPHRISQFGKVKRSSRDSIVTITVLKDALTWTGWWTISWSNVISHFHPFWKSGNDHQFSELH